MWNAISRLTMASHIVARLSLMTVDTTPERAAHKEPPPKPVVGWAVVGACFLALEAWIFSNWIGSGDADRTPSSPDVSTATEVAVRCVEVVGVLGALVMAYFCLYRPWKRDGRISLDGWLIIVFVFLAWQDPIQNYFQVHLTYNSAFYNLGSWTPHVPGWVSPNTQDIPMPLGWVAGYIWLGLGPAMLATIVMRKAKRRWPGLGRVGVVMCGLAFILLFEFTVEPLFLRTGLWAYPGAIQELTLFAGHTYQYPVYEGVLVALWWGAFACLRYFRDDKGQSWAERGLDRVGGRRRRRGAVRFLALLGICNVIFLATFSVPMMFISAHSDAWPAAFQEKPELTNGICGPGTSYACPDPALPMSTQDSVHFDPQGELIVPSGTRLPFPQDR